ncbi:MAG: sigma-54-dependent Fis family transcriptional regulator [Rhodobacteraceae bacterium]|nr:MAG: sigma-54-dependent Fis family transcriptional regulator [Paracoccaceae bacterium]
MSDINKLIVGQSAAAKELKRLIQLVAPSSATVLVQGETGTGKELVARAIHDESNRRGKLIAVNCAAIPSDLLESELFGHEKGAFTGAVNSRPGRIEQASDGTLFLDEIGDMPIALQSKLLRVLESKNVQRVGGSGEKNVDFRLVCATHQNLQAKIDSGEFRSDLFFRINVFPIDVPNLSVRAVDIPLLVEVLTNQMNFSELKSRPTFDKTAIDALCKYDWPGNIRELKNVLERASVLFYGKNVSRENVKQNLIKLKAPIEEEQDALWEASGALSQTEDLFQDSDSHQLPTAENFRSWFEFHDFIDMRRHLRDIEIVLIEAALDKTNGMVGNAADLLKIRRTTLIEKIKKFVIEKPLS